MQKMITGLARCRPLIHVLVAITIVFAPDAQALLVTLPSALAIASATARRAATQPTATRPAPPPTSASSTTITSTQPAVRFRHPGMHTVGIGFASRPPRSAREQAVLRHGFACPRADCAHALHRPCTCFATHAMSMAIPFSYLPASAACQVARKTSASTWTRPRDGAPQAPRRTLPASAAASAAPRRACTTETRARSDAKSLRHHRPRRRRRPRHQHVRCCRQNPARVPLSACCEPYQLRCLRPGVVSRTAP